MFKPTPQPSPASPGVHGVDEVLAHSEKMIPVGRVVASLAAVLGPRPTAVQRVTEGNKQHSNNISITIAIVPLQHQKRLQLLSPCMLREIALSKQLKKRTDFRSKCRKKTSNSLIAEALYLALAHLKQSNPTEKERKKKTEEEGESPP